MMRRDGVQPNAVTFVTVLLALQDAPPPYSPAEIWGRNPSTPSNDSKRLNGNPEKNEFPLDTAYTSVVGVPRVGPDGWQKHTGRIGLSPSHLPWQVAFSLLERMAMGSEGVFPGPRDFATGLTATLFGGADWSTTLQVCADPSLPPVDVRRSTMLSCVVPQALIVLWSRRDTLRHWVGGRRKAAETTDPVRTSPSAHILSTGSEEGVSSKIIMMVCGARGCPA